jgi:hypothetical protein
MEDKIKFNESMVGKKIEVCPDYWNGVILGVIDEDTFEVRRIDDNTLFNVSIFDIRQ